MKLSLLSPILILIAVLLLIDLVTTINISSSKLFKNKTLNSYPFPANGITSENYSMERLNDAYYGPILFSPSLKKFFVVGRTIFVLDGNGKTVHSFTVPNNGHAIQAAPYVETETQFFDLTQDSIQSIPFKTIWLKDDLTWPEWSNRYAAKYNKASIVVYTRYGRDANNKSAQRAFMKIDNDWWCFILHRQISLKNDHQTLITTKQFPAKAERLQYLVDPINNNVSTHTKEELFTLHQQYPQLTELKETYSTNSSSTMIFFEKSMVYEEIVYTPIPACLGGTAYYHLKIDNDILKFKDHSYRSVLSWNAINFTRTYTVPKKYESQMKAKFLVLEYPSNINESGAAGMYVIKPK